MPAALHDLALLSTNFLYLFCPANRPRLAEQPRAAGIRRFFRRNLSNFASARGKPNLGSFQWTRIRPGKSAVIPGPTD